MKSIGIIGVGNLGTHLTRLLYRNKLQSSLIVSDQDVVKACIIGSKYTTEVRNNEENIQLSEILFLTVKPNNIKEVCNQIGTITSNGTSTKTIVTAAAGIPVAKIKEWSGDNHHVVRCMPNLPISVGKGSILWYTDPQEDLEDVKTLLEKITNGPSSMWLQDEAMMDPATIISGCSPAYIAKFYKTYVNIGIEMGFSKAESEKMMRSAISGTLEILEHMSADKLVEQVASKGGATEKGLEMLEKSGFSKTIRDSSFSALERIKKITQSLD